MNKSLTIFTGVSLALAGCSGAEKRATSHADSLAAGLQARTDSLATALRMHDSADARRAADSSARARQAADSAAAELRKPRDLTIWKSSGVTVAAGKLEQHHFELTNGGACTLVGRIEVSDGGSKDAQVLVLTDDQFLNWINSPTGSTSAVFRGPSQTVTSLNLSLQSPARYHLVLSNRQAIALSRRLQGEATVTCSGGPIARLLE